MVSDAEILAMRKALKLALGGRGNTFPNPMVGAVILDSAGNQVGEGYHRKYGEPHAEVVAIASAGEASYAGTIVVTLEPCCHYGKTGPCTEQIIEAGISRVVIAMTDPDPRVNGKGIRQLESSGIDVETGVLSEEARTLNRVYIHYLETSMSWITLKMALSLDGRTASADGSSKWITSEASRKLVHGMRASAQAVMTGAGTLRDDNPELTVRYEDVPPGGQPARIVVSSTGDFGNSRKIFNASGRVVIAVPEGIKARLNEFDGMPGVEIWEFPPDPSSPGFDLSLLFRRTAAEGLGEILCEAGSTLSTYLLRNRLVNSVSIFTSPVILGGEGKPAFEHLGIGTIKDAIRLDDISSRRSGSDFLTEGSVVYRTD